MVKITVADSYGLDMRKLDFSTLYDAVEYVRGGKRFVVR